MLSVRLIDQGGRFVCNGEVNRDELPRAVVFEHELYLREAETHTYRATVPAHVRTGRPAAPPEPVPESHR